METLCDEILQLIFYELEDPSALAHTCRRTYSFSQDPYLRAHYFLARYGRNEAFFKALGRGKLMSREVFDILLNSGAHLSRYLAQIAIHHYFRFSVPFVKTKWVRSLPFPTWNQFSTIVADMYGDIPVAKGEDDGTLFTNFLKESRFPSHMKSVKWEEIKTILQDYKFIPFTSKDPTMAQFPVALAIEPRLLPFAVANGFRMDTKYRDFVFRKMFEKHAIRSDDGRVDDIIRSVRELCRLDSSMFLSRTVAAEICMEAKSNDSAYSALKTLDRSGDLRYELSALIEELIKLFVSVRSLTTSYTINVLRQLYTDFPSQDPTVRLVMLLTVFLSDGYQSHASPGMIKSKLEELNLLPLTRHDIFNILVNPFVERHGTILESARCEMGWGKSEIHAFVEEVALQCLEIECKGNTLKKLVSTYPFLSSSIASAVVRKYQISLEDLPHCMDSSGCGAYKAPLCQDYVPSKFSGFASQAYRGLGGRTTETTSDLQNSTYPPIAEVRNDESESSEDEDEPPLDDVQGGEPEPELGRIGQDTLSTMIRQDEATPRTRRRSAYYSHYSDGTGKYGYPPDAQSVGGWIKTEFGAQSPVTAIFMTHAVINNNNTVLPKYIGYESRHNSGSEHIPITLKHFKLLAHLGRAPNWFLWRDIEIGAEFFFSEEDYLSKGKAGQNVPSTSSQVKLEDQRRSPPHPSVCETAAEGTEEIANHRKRPRRNVAATIKSYVELDSDYDDGAEEEEDWLAKEQLRKRKAETNLQMWIKHLTLLLNQEQKKYKEIKKRIERTLEAGPRPRVPKSEFFKSLSVKLRDFKKQDQERRIQLYGTDIIDEYSEGEDDEYRYKLTRSSKRRKTATF